MRCIVSRHWRGISVAPSFYGRAMVETDTYYLMESLILVSYWIEHACVDDS